MMETVGNGLIAIGATLLILLLLASLLFGLFMLTPFMNLALASWLEPPATQMGLKRLWMGTGLLGLSSLLAGLALQRRSRQARRDSKQAR
ncbi:hypothetical protein [Deinococcus multiflagellatus]|uniref:Uncharacterized protein n=1 Tax=Deinococcus multiflagellatus TaxID=1656887 RepID=A0ABW1ZV74_9DEIO|nr:hypothetical protein [Deinococcus multiflagellatus]MBZ9714379.1 hypothetical protein [Deinococcus multiflagellatus]